MVEPLRIGVLGASRIAPGALIAPARELGHQVVACAARDPQRAAVYAEALGIERVHPNYQSLLDDPEIDLVYNGLANGLHGPWNLAAARAGKNVLTEKPFSSNAVEAKAVRDAATETTVIEGFHYFFHPLFSRMAEVAVSGELGTVRQVEARLVMPAPHELDPRWSLEMAGGVLMDLGCYGLHALRMLGHRVFGQTEPRVVSAKGEATRAAGVDAAMRVDLEYPDGVLGTVECSMLAPEYSFALRIVGSAGSAFAHHFVGPQFDDRLTVTTGGTERVEHLGTRPSYSYQLEAVAAHLREGAPLALGTDDSVANMELIDASYRAAGFEPRPTLTAFR